MTILPPGTRALTSDELNALFAVLENLKIQIDGFGSVSSDTSTAYYYTVSEDSVLPVRQWLFTHGFDPSEWYPHITVGFLTSDVHGVPKRPTVTVAQVLAGTVRVSQIDTELCACLLHPQVRVIYQLIYLNLNFIPFKMSHIHEFHDVIVDN